MTDLQAAKINLYRLLLEIKHDQMTDTEIELMFQLSMDKDIRSRLNKSFKNE